MLNTKNRTKEMARGDGTCLEPKSVQQAALVGFGSMFRFVATLVPCIPQPFASVAIKMGCQQGVGEGALAGGGKVAGGKDGGPSPNGAVTEPQRSRQPIFIATRRARALFRFFRVARSGNIHGDIAARSRLEKSKNRLRQMRSFGGYRALVASAALQGIASAQTQPGVVYTISAREALAGPKPADANILFDKRPKEGGVGEASISVNAQTVLGRINPMVFGACFEDLNHEIYGGVYAQMLFGESFEEGPEKDLPPGWRLHAAWLKAPVWQGMWCYENGAIGMVGFRWYKWLWSGVPFGNGSIECELMQPEFDPGRPIGVIFRAGAKEFGDGYGVFIDVEHRRMELRAGERTVASTDIPIAFGEWVHVRVEANGNVIRATANGKNIEYTDPDPCTQGKVGFEATESRGWFRNLSIQTDGKTEIPPLSPVRPSGWRGRVSQWWDPVVTGDADAVFDWDADKPFNSLRSQKIELRGGTGTAGVANRGLGRRGLSVLADHAYQGRIYCRGEYPGKLTVSLQNADGSRTYGSKVLEGVGADWRRFPFDLKSEASDHDARFVVSIDRPGKVWVDQVVLMPVRDEEWGGANEAHLLRDGNLGVLGHIACFDGEGNRHYYPMTFRLDVKTTQCSPVKIIAARSYFPPGAAKRPDLVDVVFTGGLLRNGDGTARLYAGLSDAEAAWVSIPDPFAEYEV